MSGQRRQATAARRASDGVRRCPGGAVGVIIATLLVAITSGCGGIGNSAAIPSPTAAGETPPATPEPPVETAICADGRLLVGDLGQMDETRESGLAAANDKARAWQSDARLTKLRVGCQLFEPGFRWQATYYSESAQTFFTSDTGETEPAEVAPEDVPSLPAGDISFGVLRRALAKTGYGDADVISASTGVDVRINSEAMPYGPPSTRRDALIYHVAIERLGETKDVFVDARDGTIYRYPTSQ